MKYHFGNLSTRQMLMRLFAAPVHLHGHLQGSNHATAPTPNLLFVDIVNFLGHNPC